MNRKTVSKVFLLMAAGAVSGCNSTDGPYRQGPWGSASVPRRYPEYSAPWGRRPVVPVSAVAAQPVYESIHVAEAPLHPARKIYEVHLEPELPPGPFSDKPTYDLVPGPEPLPAPGHEQSVTAQRSTSAAVVAGDPGVFTPPQRPSSYAGTWKASVGSASCRIQLSSVPSLDLYKASAQGCSSSALKTVNGWNIRDNQVILFARGEIVARLSGAEASLSGTLNGSELSMTR